MRPIARKIHRACIEAIPCLRQLQNIIQGHVESSHDVQICRSQADLYGKPMALYEKTAYELARRQNELR